MSHHPAHRAAGILIFSFAGGRARYIGAFPLGPFRVSGASEPSTRGSSSIGAKYQVGRRYPATLWRCRATRTGVASVGRTGPALGPTPRGRPSRTTGGARDSRGVGRSLAVAGAFRSLT